MIDLTGTKMVRKAKGQQDERQADHDDEEDRQRLAELGGDVDVSSRSGTDEHVRAGVAFDGGAMVADVVHQVGGRRIVGAGVGTTLISAMPPVAVETLAEATPGCRPSAAAS